MKTRKPNGYWGDISVLHKEALIYSTRSEFQRKNGSAYRYARINGLLDMVCSH
jgi:hypothetical protein